MNKIYISVVLALVLSACSPASFVKKGDRAYGQLAFSKAINSYDKALKKGAKGAHIKQRLGDSYRLLNDPQKAAIVYASVVRKKHPAKYKLYYGQMLMANGMYEEALQQFKSYAEIRGTDERLTNLTTACTRIIDLKQDRGIYRLVSTNINSAAADFGPVFYQQQLVFSSARKKSEKKFRWDQTNYLDLYSAEYHGTPKLGEMKRLKTSVNSRYHEANSTYTPDGETMYFTRNNYNKGKLGLSADRVLSLNIYEAKKKGENWAKTKDFTFNSDDYSVGHPALNHDGSWMFFTSNMPGGFGGTDLYASEKKGDSWGKPLNLGPEINTAGDEMFPWIDESGNIYFASNGHTGLGGLDIYFSRLENESYKKVTNLGVPINSEKDDFQLVIDPKRQVGFFTSNRPGGLGDDDIYAFYVNEVFDGYVTDEKTQEPLANVQVSFTDVQGNLYHVFTDQDGRFMQGLRPGTYMVNIDKGGYAPFNQKVQFKGNEPLDGQFGLAKSQDCDDSEIQMVGNTLLAGKLAPGTEVKIEFKDFVVISDTEGRLNVPLPEGFDFVVSVDDPTIKNPVIKNVSTKGLKNGAEIPVDFEFDLKGTDEPFFTIYYDYDKSFIRGYDARPELDRVVAYMNRRPEIKVALVSHTDSRGSNSYNATLSRKRAQEAYDYIISQGISKDRLKFNWEGEAVLANDCRDGVPCSEDKHQLNRRTEFRLQLQ